MIPLVSMMETLEHQNQRYQTQNRSFLCNKPMASQRWWAAGILYCFITFRTFSCTFLQVTVLLMLKTWELLTVMMINKTIDDALVLLSMKYHDTSYNPLVGVDNRILLVPLTRADNASHRFGC
mmetsp:Transcript_8488/g.17618  ORF Transcript_8488/g.17618 Transcript_8488/m.17618 type:complete len:123 (-) Transcript_8488:1509-1877(-)